MIKKTLNTSLDSLLSDTPQSTASGLYNNLRYPSNNASKIAFDHHDEVSSGILPNVSKRMPLKNITPHHNAILCHKPRFSTPRTSTTRKCGLGTSHRDASRNLHFKEGEPHSDLSLETCLSSLCISPTAHPHGSSLITSTPRKSRVSLNNIFTTPSSSGRVNNTSRLTLTSTHTQHQPHGTVFFSPSLSSKSFVSPSSNKNIFFSSPISKSFGTPSLFSKGSSTPRKLRAPLSMKRYHKMMKQSLYHASMSQTNNDKNNNMKSKLTSRRCLSLATNFNTQVSATGTRTHNTDLTTVLNKRIQTRHHNLLRETAESITTELLRNTHTNTNTNTNTCDSNINNTCSNNPFLSGDGQVDVAPRVQVSLKTVFDTGYSSIKDNQSNKSNEMNLLCVAVVQRESNHIEKHTQQHTSTYNSNAHNTLASGTYTHRSVNLASNTVPIDITSNHSLNIEDITKQHGYIPPPPCMTWESQNSQSYHIIPKTPSTRLIRNNSAYENVISSPVILATPSRHGRYNLQNLSQTPVLPTVHPNVYNYHNNNDLLSRHQLSNKLSLGLITTTNNNNHNNTTFGHCSTISRKAAALVLSSSSTCNSKGRFRSRINDEDCTDIVTRLHIDDDIANKYIYT